MSNKVYPPSAAPEATREFRMMKFNPIALPFGVHHWWTRKKSENAFFCHSRGGGNPVFRGSSGLPLLSA